MCQSWDVQYTERIERLTKRGALKIGTSRKYVPSGGMVLYSELWQFRNGSVYHLVTFRGGATELLRSSRIWPNHHQSGKAEGK
jgi:hypothetical protein